MSRTVRGVRATAIAICVLTLIVTVAGVRLVRENLPDRIPFDAWTTADTATWSVAAASAALLALAGAWLVWRLPLNPTGRWVLATGLSFSCWIAGSFRPGALSAWADQLLPTLFKATIVVAVLPWPTGRLERRWSRPFRGALVAYVLVGMGLQFVGFRPPLWLDGGRIPSVGSYLDGGLVATVSACVLQGLGPALFLAAVVRRHRAMPLSVQSSLRPALWGAGLLTLSELSIFAFDSVLAPLELQGTPWRQLSTVRNVVSVGRFGVVALLLTLAEAIRRRGADRSVTEQRVELGPLTTRADATGEVARVLGDPSARLLVGRTNQIEETRTGRQRVRLVDQQGDVVAVIDHDARTAITTASGGALLAAVELTVLRRVRATEAQSRAVELRAIQRAVVDAQDRARRQLERDLHDGAQQRLVALTLEASMLARREQANGRDTSGRDALYDSIEASIELTRDIMTTVRPAVVDPGLVAGLTALEATLSIQSTLDAEGDLPAAHPATAMLWFVASEAVANALKHSRASRIGLHLRVDDEVAELTVTDDGIGGAVEPPDAVVRRLAGVSSSVSVDSPPGRGTTLRVRIDLVDVGAPV